jgi:BTB/POZ domain-containing protein 13
LLFSALNVVFGSFYLDEMSVEPCVVVGVIAAAILFQMDGLIDQCSDIMVENICPLVG